MGKLTDQKNLSFADFGAFISSLIDQLALKDICLVGHSMGGAIALFTAVQNKNVSRLILIDPYGLPLGTNRFNFLIRYAFEFFIELAETIQVRNFLHTIANLYRIGRNIRYILPFSLKIFNQQLQEDTELFSKIQVPTLIVWGSNDAIGQDYAKLMQQRIPHAQIRFVSGTHNWIIFRPEELTKYI